MIKLNYTLVRNLKRLHFIEKLFLKEQHQDIIRGKKNRILRAEKYRGYKRACWQVAFFKVTNQQTTLSGTLPNFINKCCGTGTKLHYHLC
jgi:hypothetical protein